MIRRPPRSTLSSSSAASDVYKRQVANYKQMLDRVETTDKMLSLSELELPTRLQIQAVARSLLGKKAQQKAFRQLAMMWHPDKFWQHFGSAICQPDGDQAKQQVHQVFLWLQECLGQ
eukprot:TRINITY_DN15654_c0_g1_i1.p1 TRINITY_DN15654_c0_g1~~TRINITY_DN15654_c0_g1_i1.p1  ORF type:complete len:117 (+),score=38.17 TRINITY_DN15654_c0_g1_i1:76-426(+)